MGGWATELLPYGGSPTFQSRGQNQQWPTSGADRVYKSCRLAVLQRSIAGDKSTHDPHVGGLVAQSLRWKESRTLQSEAQNQKWRTTRQIGYITLAVPRVPKASKQGTKATLARKWADRRHNLCGVWSSQCFKAGIQSRNWPTRGHIGDITVANSGVPNASMQGTTLNVAQKWEIAYITPDVYGSPTLRRMGQDDKWRFTARVKIRSGPQMSGLAPYPLPSGWCPTLQTGEQNQQWPTSERIGNVNPDTLGSPTLQSGGQKQHSPTLG